MRALKELAKQLLNATEDDVIVVNELTCTEPGCPPVETVIARLRTGAPPWQIKVHKPAAEVTRADLAHALEAPHSHER
jgi:hypothetical protein